MNKSQVTLDVNLFNLVTGVILTIVGLTGNGLVTYVLSRKKFLEISMFRYFLISVIFQTFRIFMFWPFDAPGLLVATLFTCHLFEFLSIFLKHYVAYIEVIISVDRYISVIHPHSIHQRNKFKFQLTILTIFFIVLIPICAPHYYYYVLYLVPAQNTTFNCNIRDILAHKWLIFYELFFEVLVPFVVVFYTTSRVGFHLIKNRKNIKSKKEIRLFKILLGMNLFFFFFMFQYLIYQLVNQIWIHQQLDVQIELYIAGNISTFVVDLYCSITFFIHFVCNKKFRNYVKSFVGIKLKSKLSS